MNGIPPERRMMGRWAEDRHCSMKEVIVEKKVEADVVVVVVVVVVVDDENDERMRMS